MPPATLSTLKKSAEAIGTDKMEAEYINKMVADLPTMNFSYYSKTISFMEFMAPEELKTLCKALDDSLETLKWEKIEE